jgi:hypothetical protein
MEGGHLRRTYRATPQIGGLMRHWWIKDPSQRIEPSKASAWPPLRIVAQVPIVIDLGELDDDLHAVLVFVLTYETDEGKTCHLPFQLDK